jgi:hypothetical protein
MSDFDSNEDVTRLPGSGEAGEPEPRVVSRPFVHRQRQAVIGHSAAASRGIPLLVSRRRQARRECLGVGRPLLVEAPSRRARRLWWAACPGGWVGRDPDFRC